MGKPQNHFLAKRDAEKEAVYQQRLRMNSEFDLIAFMITINEELKVGPGRAGRLLNAFLANKVELAETIHEDYGDKDKGDKELLHTKHSYAKRLRSIFSPEDWQTAREWFPLLQRYWEG